ncbi:MAG: hypothetical protein HY907_19985 [Deltaproteobacteria bacterium]|nr:hypothetical protein [Deltaproteobacteria bacterium]
MRVLIQACIPVQTGNRALKDGTLQNTMMGFIERVRPEAAYFGLESGQRTGYFVVDLKESSDLPPLLEPLFTNLDAEVKVTPIMNAEDLKKGLSKLGKT